MASDAMRNIFSSMQVKSTSLDNNLVSNNSAPNRTLQSEISRSVLAASTLPQPQALSLIGTIPIIGDPSAMNRGINATVGPFVRSTRTIESNAGVVFASDDRDRSMEPEENVEDPLPEFKSESRSDMPWYYGDCNTYRHFSTRQITITWITIDAQGNVVDHEIKIPPAGGGEEFVGGSWLEQGTYAIRLHNRPSLYPPELDDAISFFGELPWGPSAKYELVEVFVLCCDGKIVKAVRLNFSCILVYNEDGSLKETMNATQDAPVDLSVAPNSPIQNAFSAKCQANPNPPGIILV